MSLQRVFAASFVAGPRYTYVPTATDPIFRFIDKMAIYGPLISHGYIVGEEAAYSRLEPFVYS
jgi:hypothetical protein